MESNRKDQIFFFGGENTDTDVALQPKNTYRMLTGFNIVSNTDNSYAIESEKGNSVIFSLLPYYTPIGWFKQGYKMIIISTSDGSGLQASRVKSCFSMVDISPATHAGTPVHLYVHKDLGFKIEYQHEGHAFFESPKIQRAYTTDDNVPPKVLNYGNPIFTTYFAVNVVHPINTYMVVSGVVNYLGIDYGPNEVDNIFTTNGINAFTLVSGAGLVIEYVPVELLDWTPLYRPGQIRFNKWLPGGGLENGSYQVAFQLIGFDGVTTPWSFVSKPVATASGYPGLSLSNYQGLQGKGNSVNSSKGLQFIIDSIDTNYKTIRVAAIRCTSVFVQDQPVLFYEGIVTGPSMTIDYYGNENISQLSDNDINEIFNYIKKVNSIQPVKNRMAGLNWEKNPDIDYDPSTCKIKCIEYLCPTDVVEDVVFDNSYNSGTWGSIPAMTGHAAQPYTITAGQNVIYPYAWYEVLSGPTFYEGILRPTGTYFQGRVFEDFITGIGTVCAVLRIQLYGGVYRYIRLDNDFLDNKSSLVDNYLRSNWRVEKYRYGLELVDLAGNPIFVRWAGDKSMIAQSNTSAQIDPETGNAWGFDGSLMKFDSGNGRDATSLRHIGVQFDDLDIQGIVDALIISTGDTSLTVFDLPKYYSGFRLVRAPRDRQILCQGMITPCYEGGSHGGVGTDTYCAADIRVNSNEGTRQDQLYTLYSPDLNFQTSGSPAIDTDDKMRIESYAEIRKEVTSIGNPVEYVIDKFEDAGAVGAGATPIGYVMPFDNVEKNSLVEPNADWNFQGTQEFHNWGELDAGGGNRSSVGARTYFLATANSEGAGDLLNGFGFWTGFNIIAPIVSVIRQKANLYGGSSESAKANTKYEYCGHYQSFDTAFLTYVNGNAGKADGIQVFGGDCWVSYWDFCRTMDNNVANTRNYVSIFAVESNTNVMLRDGRHPALSGPASPGIQWDTPPVIPEQWLYNSAFSADENTYFDPALPVNFIPNNKYPYQAIYSNAKLLGEFTDAFRKFDLANKRDLDGSGGAGINLRLKNDRLFYWQEYMMGYLPVEERANVPVGLNEPMIIGTGGIMPRYDTVDNFYGNFHQFGLTETENGFVWFDRNKRALCYFDASVTSLSASQGRISFFQNNLNNDILINDRPISGSGIAGVYDSRFKKVLMVFKGSPIGDFTISYDVKSKIFLGAHPYSPGILFDLNQFLYSCFPGWYSAPGIQPNHVYTVGDKITDASINYVCIATYTTPASPIAPGSDSTHWVAVNTNNQIYLHNSNDIGKFYGIVEDEAFEIIANQEKDKTKIWNNYEFTGNDVFWNDITCSTTDQAGQDVGITSGVLSQYRYMDRKWYGTIPQDAVTGRLRDVFIKILMEKQNRLNGSPVTSTNKMLKMSSITVLYNEDY